MSYIRTFCETYGFDTELPADNSLHRAYIKWLDQGGTVGEGFGFFLCRE